MNLARGILVWAAALVAGRYAFRAAAGIPIPKWAPIAIFWAGVLVGALFFAGCSAGSPAAESEALVVHPVGAPGPENAPGTAPLSAVTVSSSGNVARDFGVTSYALSGFDPADGSVYIELRGDTGATAGTVALTLTGEGGINTSLTSLGGEVFRRVTYATRDGHAARFEAFGRVVLAEFSDGAAVTLHTAGDPAPPTERRADGLDGTVPTAADAALLAAPEFRLLSVVLADPATLAAYLALANGVVPRLGAVLAPQDVGEDVLCDRFHGGFYGATMGLGGFYCGACAVASELSLVPGGQPAFPGAVVSCYACVAGTGMGVTGLATCTVRDWLAKTDAECTAECVGARGLAGNVGVWNRTTRQCDCACHEGACEATKSQKLRPGEQFCELPHCEGIAKPACVVRTHTCGDGYVDARPGCDEACDGDYGCQPGETCTKDCGKCEPVCTRGYGSLGVPYSYAFGLDPATACPNQNYTFSPPCEVTCPSGKIVRLGLGHPIGSEVAILPPYNDFRCCPIGWTFIDAEHASCFPEACR